VTVFQPHRYSRTLLCWDQFVDCFNETDKLYVCDIYPAGEDPIANVNSARLCREIEGSQLHREGGVNVAYLPNSVDRLQLLRGVLTSGDVLVTLGAGDIYKLGMQLLESER
jgi:UDP-N-acetylmuramate--alanine ligase